MLDATRLRVLVAVARHGSVTAAAAALNYAQPSVSHHMARLEAETGVKLMERAGRGVRLTPAGQLLAGRAAEILGKIDAAEAELAAAAGRRAGRLRVAAFGAALREIVAPAVAAVHASLPGTDIYLTQAEPDRAVAMLRACETDLALVFRFCLDAGPPPWPSVREPDLVEHLVLDEPVYLVTHDAASPADLARYADSRWIACGRRGREFLIRLCRRAGYDPEIGCSTEDYTAAVELVRAGLGVTILPGLALRTTTCPGVSAAEIGDAAHHVLALTDAAPQVPAATARLVTALTSGAQRLVKQRDPRDPGFPRSRPTAPATHDQDVRAGRRPR